MPQSNGFHYFPAPHMGRIDGPPPGPVAKPANLTGGVLIANVIPYDYRTYYRGMPIAMPYGMIRLPRSRQSIIIQNIDGGSQARVAGMHTFNLEPLGSGYEDPLPLDGAGTDIFVHSDDLVIYHDETNAYLRFRNTNPGMDQSPAQFDLQFRSGMGLQVIETDGTPGAGQASATLRTPNGAEISLANADASSSTATVKTNGGAKIVLETLDSGDETLTVSLTTSNGPATLTIDSAGNAKFLVPDGATVSLGDNVGNSYANKVALLSDLQALESYLNTHIHTGVLTGPLLSGPPAVLSPVPVCATKTHAA